MNFFEAQDRARRNTGLMVMLFAAAVVALVALVNLLAMEILAYGQTGRLWFSAQAFRDFYSLQYFAAVSAAVGLLILGGSLFKAMEISGGGAAVAEKLGGRLVSRGTGDLRERQLLNVVEEMAIAAGMPVPQVYLLPETSINAFAAGKTPANAVIGITEGALGRLDRDELQGVVAHEFSHIANGDMRLNIRLIAVLHGILLLGLIGYFLLRSLRFAGRSRSRGGSSAVLGVVALGAGLMVIGYAGTFFGQIIKAVVSRQREYLADSSAVQFTRNTDGIAGALKKIGGAGHVGSALGAPAAPEYSHAYFANGLTGFWQTLFATHPPLDKRIVRIDPGWDGEFVASEIRPPPSMAEVEAAPAPGAPAAAVAVALTSAEQAIGQVGTLNEQNVAYVHALIAGLPLVLREAVRDSYSARAVVFAALVVLQQDREAAFRALAGLCYPDLLALVERLIPELDGLEEEARLPLLELAVTALRELSLNQYDLFRSTVRGVIASDRRISLGEWIVQRFLLQQLDEHFARRDPPQASISRLREASEAVTTILSLIARIEHRDDAAAAAAFGAGAAAAGLVGLDILPAADFSVKRLDEALDRLARLKPLAKPKLLRACVAVILHDDRTTPRGIELVRTISICLDCPMPPLRPADAAPAGG